MGKISIKRNENKAKTGRKITMEKNENKIENKKNQFINICPDFELHDHW